MKHKIFFTLLLALIVTIGINGVDIAESFFNDQITEETEIPRDASQSKAVYFASPNEISFHPMDIIKTDALYTKPMGINYDNLEKGKKVCSAIVRALSTYSKTTTYDLPFADNAEQDFKLSSNSYLYLENHMYLNPDGELRYVDCIISVDDYRIVYINFYNSKEYNLDSNDINNSLEKFSSYSINYDRILDYAYKIMDEFETTTIHAYNLNELYEAFMSALSAADFYIDKLDPINPIEYFWIRSYFLCNVEFEQFSIYNYGYDADYEESYFSSITGTRTHFEILDNMIASYYGKSIEEDFEYVAYNGRIYHTINFEEYFYYYCSSLITIYNIEDDIIEGFYMPPNP